MAAAQATDLTPCPFCAGEAVLIATQYWSERQERADPTGDTYNVACKACHARGPLSDRRGKDMSPARDEWLQGKARGAWNRRWTNEAKLAVFFNKTAHGSDAHRAWLAYEIERFYGVQLDRRLIAKALKEP